MTDRERFEAAMISADKGYMLGGIFRLFEEWTPDELYGIWQESRRQALEEAARTAECYDLGTPEGHDIAEHLRALANPEGEQG